MNKPIILHLCADTGTDSWAYQQDPNYEVILVGRAIGVENYHPPSGVVGIIANPVCTYFSQLRRGAHQRETPEAGLPLVEACLRVIKEAAPRWWVLENPATGSLRKYLGTPQAVYQPWQYGSPWSKATALWGSFNMPHPLFNKWADVPERIAEFWIRKGRQIPSLAYQHKSAYRFVPEFQNLPAPQTDSEFRSYCSQRFATEFKEVNP